MILGQKINFALSICSIYLAPFQIGTISKTWTGVIILLKILSDQFVLDFLSSYPQIGEISKKWTGLGEEMFTDADNFGVSFPVDLDIKVI